MKKKEWIKTICFIAGFFLILIPLTILSVRMVILRIFADLCEGRYD